jgi:hypothetical protein
MAVTRTISKKAPSQSPVDFFNCKQAGGSGVGGSTATTSGKVGDKIKSGPMREQVYGRKSLSK